ncbi:MAG: nuclear transport factor 2 family protein [Thermoleophilaceae bacterium]
MYRRFVRRRVRRGFELLSTGQLDTLMAGFADDSVLAFPGEQSFGGEQRGADAIRAWFDALLRLFPDFRVEPGRILVEGGPWHTRVATRFDIHATLPDGASYRNEGVQLLDLRWGRVREDRLFEDTARPAVALERLAELGAPVGSIPGGARG